MREEGQGEALTSVGMLGRELQAAGAELGAQRALQDGGGARALGAAQQLRAARRAAQRQRREHALHVCAQHNTIPHLAHYSYPLLLRPTFIVRTDFLTLCKSALHIFVQNKGFGMKIWSAKLQNSYIKLDGH